jgi:cell wall-associated NlpC family hydrolase
MLKNSLITIFLCFAPSLIVAAEMPLHALPLQNATGDEIVVLDDSIQATDLAVNAITQQNQALPANSLWQNKVQELMINALSLTGIQYKYGGKTPETGFDCSGFVRYVFSHATNLSLPSTAHAIAQIGHSIKKEELQPGDLVFFNTLKSAFSHVGIYLGDNKFIHAPRTGAEVRVEKLSSYWLSRFDGAQRLDKEVENHEVEKVETKQ